MKLYNRIGLNSLLVSLFPIVLIFLSIDVFEFNNYIFLLIFLVLTFFTGLISTINLNERTKGFRVGCFGAADSLFLLSTANYILFSSLNIEISFISQISYSGVVLFGIFLSYGYIAESEEKGLTPFKRAAYIPFLPIVIFFIVSISMGLSFFFTYLIIIAISFSYSIISGFGGLFGTFIKTTKSYKPKVIDEPIAITTPAIHVKCPVCNIDMDPLVTGIFQCPSCKKIFNQKEKKNENGLPRLNTLEEQISNPSSSSTQFKKCPHCGYRSYKSDVCPQCKKPLN